MPSIDIQVMAGVFTPEETAELITRVTDAFGSVSGQTVKADLSVRVHEVRSGAWGHGGVVLRTEDGLAMRARG